MIKEKLYKAVMSHAQGMIDKSVANIEVLMTNPSGMGQHGDIVSEIIKELKTVSEYEGIKKNLDKHMGNDKVNLTESKH